VRKHFLIEQGMNWFRNSGLYDLSDTVSLPESMPSDAPQEVLMYTRIDVYPWTHSLAFGVSSLYRVGIVEAIIYKAVSENWLWI
jgi:hypothetical protein